jgi:hypothetical protein
MTIGLWLASVLVEPQFAAATLTFTEGALRLGSPWVSTAQS